MDALLAQEAALAEFVGTLEAHVANCVRGGRYIEAEVARVRLGEVWAAEGDRRRAALAARQLSEALGVEEAFLAEFAAFNAGWDAAGAAFEARAAAALCGMGDRHAVALRDFQQRLLVRGAGPRHSTKYRDLRHAQGALARARHYAAAGATKAAADGVLAEEEERWYAERQADALRKEGLLAGRLAVEVEGLKRRLAGARAEAARKRAGELERLLQRFANVKAAGGRAARGEAAALEKALVGEELARRAEASRAGAGGRRGGGK